MTTPTGNQMNEAQVAEYIKWLEKEIGDIESDSDEYEAGLLAAFEDARNKLLSLLSSSSTTPSTEEVLRGMKAISDGFFNKKDYESAGRILAAMDVIERELKNKTI